MSQTKDEPRHIKSIQDAVNELAIPLSERLGQIDESLLIKLSIASHPGHAKSSAQVPDAGRPDWPLKFTKEGDGFVDVFGQKT